MLIIISDLISVIRISFVHWWTCWLQILPCQSVSQDTCMQRWWHVVLCLPLPTLLNSSVESRRYWNQARFHISSNATYFYPQWCQIGFFSFCACPVSLGEVNKACVIYTVSCLALESSRVRQLSRAIQFPSREASFFSHARFAVISCPVNFECCLH